MKIYQENTLGKLGRAIGNGLLAGVAATAAITISQMIEMSISKRQPSEAPVKVVSETVGAKPAHEEDKEKLSHEIHWAYGSVWGISRGIIGLTGLRGFPAALVHFATVWGTSLIMLPHYKAAKPVNEREPQEITIDALHHAVYALTATVVYDALDAGSKNQRRLDKLDRLINQLRFKGLLNKIRS
ncbi:MAG TPA: hypothetical protein VIQ77_00675 [Mucilaginibacter sp.]